MPVKTSACLEVGAALAAAISGAADVGVRLVVLHKNSCIPEVTITATSGEVSLELELLHISKTYRSQKSVPSGSCE